MMISAEVGGSIVPNTRPPPRPVLVRTPAVGVARVPIGRNTPGSLGLVNGKVPGIFEWSVAFRSSAR